MNKKKFINISSINIRKDKAKSFFIFFYAIGIAGMIIPFSFPLFVRLTPLAIILSLAALFYFHENKKEKKTLIIFFSIYFLSFLVELIGVNTKIIFGDYSYGKGLGLKLFNTPLLIGMNWVLLIYLSANITSRLKLKSVASIFVASLIMVIYDFILEHVAPLIDMWSWKDDVVPLQNYIVWFLLSVLFHSIIKVFRVKTENQLALVIFLCQLAFLTALYFLLNLFQ